MRRWKSASRSSSNSIAGKRHRPRHLLIGRPHPGVQHKLLQRLQGNDLKPGNHRFAQALGLDDQWRQRRHRHHIEHPLRRRNCLGGKCQLASLDTTGHANRRDIHQHRRAQVAQRRLPAITATVGQLPPGLLIAGDDDALGKARITQGTGHRLGHAAAAAQGEGGRRVDLVLLEQSAHGQVIGVVGLEVTVGVDDGIDRLDRRRRRVDFIDQGHAGFLVRHRYTAATNAQGTNAADRRRQVLGGHGLVVIIQPQLLIQMVMKTHTKSARTPGQRDAQHGVFAWNNSH